MRLSTLMILLTCALFAPAALGRPPNIIIFYADDLGNGDIGCFGCRDIRTPEIDRVAGDGIRLTGYYAAAPICAPSRAALLTGRYPTRAGMSTEQNIPSAMDAAGVSGREVMLPELLRPRGYASALIGKWHLGSTHDTQPNAQGFDLFFGHHASCIDSFSHMYYASTPYYHDLYRNREEVFEDGRHMTDLITRETVRFISAHRDQPFFAYVSYNTPHYPMVCQSRFLHQYAHLPVPRRWHAALVAGIDESVGAIMGRVRQLGLLEDTFVFFSSDNGTADASDRGEGGGSNAPYREYKRSLFDGGIHMPAIVSWPGHLPSGESRDQLAIAMDVFATAAELAGAELPAGRVIDGRSWMPFLRDGRAAGHERVFFEWAGQHAARSGRWKVVRNGLIDMTTRGRQNHATGEDHVFLADVQADPGEQKNLRQKHPEVAERLLDAYDRWRAEVAADPTTEPVLVPSADAP